MCEWSPVAENRGKRKMIMKLKTDVGMRKRARWEAGCREVPEDGWRTRGMRLGIGARRTINLDHAVLCSKCS